MRLCDGDRIQEWGSGLRGSWDDGFGYLWNCGEPCLGDCVGGGLADLLLFTKPTRVVMSVFRVQEPRKNDPSILVQ